MERVRPTAVAIVLCVALLAAACSGDDGGDDAEPGASSLDAVLGTQAVQDFAIHLGAWAFDGDGGLVDVLGPLVDRAVAGVSETRVLAGGFSFAPVEGIDGWVVDPAGDTLPTLSVDFGVIAPPEDAASDTRRSLGLEDDAPSPSPRDEGAMLVEIVTADFADARVHLGLGDRSEIDMTFVEELEPGDRVVVQYLFGQTYPGDPAREAGLTGLELFVERWNQGHIRVAADGGVPEPIVSSSAEVREGSTILSRDQKQDLAVAAGIAASSFDPIPELYDDYLNREFGRGDVLESSEEVVYLDVPGSEQQLQVRVRRSGGVTTSAVIRGPFPTPVAVGGSDPLSNAARVVETIRFLVACAAVKMRLMAENEAGRAASPFARFATTRFLPQSVPGGAEESADQPIDGEPDDGEPDDGGSDDADSAPFGCGVPTPPDPDLLRGCPDGGVRIPEPEAGEAGEEAGDSGEDASSPALEIPPLCNDPTGGTHGDVRFLTFDGAVYAQQAVGEFLVVETDSTVIQMRAEPAGRSEGASIATAFAVGTGGESVALHRGGRSYVNGELREMERGERIRAGEAEVMQGLQGWTIAWPDGQLVDIFDRGEVNGMTLTVQIPRGKTGVVGQLGDGDGDPDNDFRTRDGRQLDDSISSIVGDRDEFYGTYVDSWRITQDESLLHYADGETTETFLIEGFPLRAITIDDLDPDERAEAEQICEAASVVDDRFFDGCVVDIAITGDPGYAYDAFRVQLVAPPSPDVRSPDSDPDPVDVPAGTPGDTLLTIGGESLVFGVDPPNQRPRGIQASWNCQIIDGDLFADGSIDLADGPRYSITVRYLASDSRLTLLLETPNEDGLTRNYAWVDTSAPHFADAIDTMTLDDQRFTVTGDLYVNEQLERGAPGSVLPDGATFDPFTLDLDCVS